MNDVSLYVPCYNASGTLAFCLDSVFQQSHPLTEVVVVDDGSSDETARIAGRYPVRLLRHSRNLGLAVSRNTAIKNISSEFIASLDADCVVSPDWLKRLMAGFKDAEVAGAGGKLIEDPSDIFSLWRSLHMKQHWGGKRLKPDFLFGSNNVLRRSAVIAAGLYDESLKNNYEDVEICRRLKKRKCVFVYEPQAAVRHLKKDCLATVLNSYWRWHRAYYLEKNFYANRENFIFKLSDNIGLSNRFLREDALLNNDEILYLDFLLCLHHSLKDLEYFTFQEEKQYQKLALGLWISLLDTAFFLRYNHSRNAMQTLVPGKNSLLQNSLALILVMAKVLKERFGSDGFSKKLYKDILLSVYGIEDNYLLEKVETMAVLRGDWQDLACKSHPNLNRDFLNGLASGLDSWLGNLSSASPLILRRIEACARSAG